MNAPLLRLAEAQRVATPTVFLPGYPTRDPQPCPDLAEAAARVKAMAEGAPVELRMGWAAYPEFEPFASITVSAAGRMLCIVGGPWREEAAQAQACAELRRAVS